jgi:ribosomal protein S18 acetylase RimI-like enzyme
MEILKTYDYKLIARLNKDVQDVHVSLYPEYFNTYDFEAMRDFYMQHINNPNFDFLVIKIDKEFVGYAWIEEREYVENVFMKGYRFLFIHQISINKEYRNQGIGLQFMNKIEDIARERGIHRIQLDYWSNNISASAFYNKNGYTKFREFVYKEV